MKGVSDGGRAVNLGKAIVCCTTDVDTSTTLRKDFVFHQHIKGLNNFPTMDINDNKLVHQTI